MVSTGGADGLRGSEGSGAIGWRRTPTAGGGSPGGTGANGGGSFTFDGTVGAGNRDNPEPRRSPTSALLAQADRELVSAQSWRALSIDSEEPPSSYNASPAQSPPSSVALQQHQFRLKVATFRGGFGLHSVSGSQRALLGEVKTGGLNDYGDVAALDTATQQLALVLDARHRSRSRRGAAGEGGTVSAGFGQFAKGVASAVTAIASGQSSSNASLRNLSFERAAVAGGGPSHSVRREGNGGEEKGEQKIERPNASAVASNEANAAKAETVAKAEKAETAANVEKAETAQMAIDHALFKRFLISFFGSVEGAASRLVRSKAQNEVLAVMCSLLNVSKEEMEYIGVGPAAVVEIPGSGRKKRRPRVKRQAEGGRCGGGVGGEGGGNAPPSSGGWFSSWFAGEEEGEGEEEEEEYSDEDVANEFATSFSAFVAGEVDSGVVGGGGEVMQG